MKDGKPLWEIILKIITSSQFIKKVIKDWRGLIDLILLRYPILILNLLNPS